MSVPWLTRFVPAGFPDPFAVATINGDQTQTTQASKRSLNPYWNEQFDLYVVDPRLTYLQPCRC